MTWVLTRSGGNSEADDFIDMTKNPSTTVLWSTPISSPPEEQAGPSTTHSRGRPHLINFPESDISDVDLSDDFVDDSDADPTFDPNPYTGRHLFRRMKDVHLNRSHVSSTSEESDTDEPNQNIKIQKPVQKNTKSKTLKKTKAKKVKTPEPSPFNFSKDNKEPKTYNDFEFTQPMGPKVPIDISTPITIFLLIIGPFLDHIVAESNNFAEQKLHTLNLTKDELLAFFGLLIIMGFLVLPSMRLCWSTKRYFRVEPIAEVMSLRRFLLILRFLHLNDNKKMPQRGEPNFDRLYKLRPMINFLKKQYGNLFSPSRFLSVDESMVAFKGRSALKQYLSNKTIKRGFKVWAIACAVTGFFINFDVYEGKATERDKEETLGEHVALGLAKAFETLGYCIFFDRFFTNLILIKKLLSKKLFGCGTTQSDRKYFPRDMLEKDTELQIGDSDFAADGEISVINWKDKGKKSVKIASNMHDPKDCAQIDRKDKDGNKIKVKCPKAVADTYMGGVDHFDHYKSSYSIAQKSRRWWVKIFDFLLESVLVNSYILYKYISKKNRKKPMQQLLFREKLAAELIGDFCSRKPRNSSLIKGSKISGRRLTNIDLSSAGDHLAIPTTSRRCARCSTKEGQEVEHGL